MAKRKQVKNACVNCQKACKKCDDCRPCTRCIKYGIENSCVNSSRKERRKGIKRGPYRATPSGSRDLPDTEDSWTPDSERSVRTRRPINYREPKDMSDDEEEESDEDGDGEEAKRTSSKQQTRRSKLSMDERHTPLFRMVLGVMHGDLLVPAEQPKLLDLAAVCSDMYEMEFLHKQQHFQANQRLQIKLDVPNDPFINYEADRAENNRTPGPVDFLKRDVPSPPSTPLSIKLPHNPGHGKNSPHLSSPSSSPYYSPMPILSAAAPHARPHFNSYGSPY